MASDEPDLSLSRRAALVGLAAAGCATGAAAEPENTAGVSNPDWRGSTAVGDAPRVGGDEFARPSTGSGSASVDAETLAENLVLDAIEHVVVVVMENRSFDHYLGALALDPAYRQRANVDGLRGTESNVATDGQVIGVQRVNAYRQPSLPHDWKSVHEQWGNGANDGFARVAQTPAGAHHAMNYYDRSELPIYYWFADQFVVCDRWFCSVLGPTYPNRAYLQAGTSGGGKDAGPDQPTITIWDVFRNAGLAAVNYCAGAATMFAKCFPGNPEESHPAHPIDDFFEAARSGSLPAFSLIDPDWDSSDDHPTHDPRLGQAFVASIYAAVSQGPHWTRTLLIVTYDEHGGFFDHVPPPAIRDDNEGFTRLGFRVPAFVIGPMVKQNYVCHTVVDHTSVLDLACRRWRIAPLSTRVAVSNGLVDCLDTSYRQVDVRAPRGLPLVAFRRDENLHVGETSQPQLQRLIDEGKARRVDQRGSRERFDAWVERAVTLGVIRILDGAK